MVRQIERFLAASLSNFVSAPADPHVFGIRLVRMRIARIHMCMGFERSPNHR